MLILPFDYKTKICKPSRLLQLAMKHQPQLKNFVFFTLNSKLTFRRIINNLPFSFVFCLPHTFPSIPFPLPSLLSTSPPPSTLQPLVLDVRAPLCWIRVPFHVIPFLPPSLSVGSLPYLPLFFSFHEKCHTPTRSSNAPQWFKGWTFAKKSNFDFSFFFLQI